MNQDSDDGPVPDTFPEPAPQGGWGDALRVFDDTNRNGTWQLFVVDENSMGAESRLEGWQLTFSYSAISAPKAKADAYPVKEDRTLRRAAPGVLGNDVDPDDDPLTTNSSPARPRGR